MSNAFPEGYRGADCGRGQGDGGHSQRVGHFFDANCSKTCAETWFVRDFPKQPTVVQSDGSELASKMIKERALGDHVEWFSFSAMKRL